MLKLSLLSTEKNVFNVLPIGPFTGRLIVIAIVVAVTLSLWQLTNVLALLFGAILISIGLHAAARAVVRLVGIREIYAVYGVFIMVVLIFSGAFWIFGATTVTQVNQVMLVAPEGFQLVMDQLSQSSYGRLFLEQARGTNVMNATGWATSVLTSMVAFIIKGIGYAVITLFVSVYLAFEPKRYSHLCIRLIPPDFRDRTRHFFDLTENILQRWLVGQLVIMATIGVLSGLGLWLLGVEAAFALGLVGGLLCFIPYVGAILAAVPAVLVALTMGPIHALYVVILYLIIHSVEGNFITPLVQAEATSLPPVLAMLSTIAFSILFGVPGILLAAPLTLLLITATEILYVQNGLGEAPE